jgi:hypothetical protein
MPIDCRMTAGIAVVAVVAVDSLPVARSTPKRNRLLTSERVNKTTKLSVLRGAHIESIAICPEAKD